MTDLTDDLGPAPLRHCELPCCNPAAEHSAACDAGLDICDDCRSYGAQDGA